MIKPLGNNVLLKVKNVQKSIIVMPNEFNDLYEVIAQGNLVNNDLVGKIVFVKNGLEKLELDNENYYLVDEKQILAVVEE